MSEADPQHPLLTLGDLAKLAAEATAAIAAVHRRPVSLRRSDLTGAESVLRGARTSALIDDPATRLIDEPTGVLGSAISVYGLLAPDRLQTSAGIFGRAPLQILARMDVLSGGEGIPEDPSNTKRLHHLATVITSESLPAALLPQVVHGEILGRQIFGERSGTIARAASRLAAVADGFDPRGLAVPEPYLSRHRGSYLETVATFDQNPVAFMELGLRSWIAGAQEAESIARAV
ncbi:hypothetical protein [Corynebacterium alimapuense]|uniref:Oxidoreductase n=1 Tax=Corynebacterium alimapuense TaxID=1576874 RepID=A0A3M8K9E7_9CORY|nr:hypothetical protein [Corynebacterium alimapuense]RNE49078.1 hypothetical protein C5L39_06940 [Corynebacterium alimapuense]